MINVCLQLICTFWLTVNYRGASSTFSIKFLQLLVLYTSHQKRGFTSKKFLCYVSLATSTKWSSAVFTDFLNDTKINQFVFINVWRLINWKKLKTIIIGNDPSNFPGYMFTSHFLTSQSVEQTKSYPHTMLIKQQWHHLTLYNEVSHCNNNNSQSMT